jgi:hypothetical protein
VGRYRYWSWRAWDRDLPTLGWILLRPNDRVLSKVMGWSYRNGYGSVSVVHLFAARATDFKLLLAMSDPVGPECDGKIFYEMSRVGRFVCAWTDYALKRGRATSFLADPRWGSISDRAFAFKISRMGQPSFTNRFLGGMVPFQTPRVSVNLSDAVEDTA